MKKTSYSEKLKHPLWQKKRLEIMKRDKFSCRICGDKENMLNVHHISYSPDPTKTDSKLLLTLCEDCHKHETERLKEVSYELIKKLKDSGFMSLSLCCLSNVFKDKDRGWAFYEPAFDIIKMAIDDDLIWKKLEDIFWERLSEKHKPKLKT